MTARRLLLPLLLLGVVGCGRIADDAGSGGASSSGGSTVGSGGTASGGQVGSGGSAPGTGSGGGLVIPPEIITDTPTSVEDYLGTNRMDAPFDHDLPDVPEDYLPPLPVGEPGWRDSTDGFCSDILAKHTAGIWADADGVAVLATSHPRVLDSFQETGAELWYNDGSGWEWLLVLGDGAGGLSGVAGGDLLFQGERAIAIGRDGEVHGGSPDEAGFALSLFGDGMGPAYGTFHENTNAPEAGHLYRYGGGEWTKLATYEDPTYVQDLVVVEDVAYVVLGSSIGRAALGSAFEPIPGLPSQDYMTLGALAEDDLWAATYSGTVLHYDGTSLTQVGQVEGEGGVLQFHAIEGEMYFITETVFGRVTDSAIEVIQELDDLAAFQGLAGVSADEVFVAVKDQELQDYDCTGLEVFVFDGEEFHQF
jgi:hypothetical protein